MMSENDEIVSPILIAFKGILSRLWGVCRSDYFPCGTHLRITSSKTTEGMTFLAEINLMSSPYKIMLPS